ncbi:stage II sporulation protein M [Chloroflexota bacterium]
MPTIRYKIWVFIATGLFVIGIAAGLIISATMPAGITGLLSEELSVLGELSTMFGPFQATTAVFIFLKNVSSLLFSFIFSPILCLMPVIALVLNGTLLSFVSVIVTREASLGLLLAGVLPHGILEIPAFIMGEAAALSFGATAIMALLSRERRNQLLPNLKQNSKYLLLAFGLLVPAAIIETFVTPLLLQ